MKPDKDAPVPGLDPAGMMDMIFAFQKSRAILTAFELGIFTAIGDGSRSSAEIAAVIGADARATDRLLNALAAMGFVFKRESRFTNIPAAGLLVKGKPDYAEGLMHAVHLWDSWSTLTKAVREGRSVASKPVDERDESAVRSFIAAMHYRAKMTAPGVVALIDLTGVKRIIDVGGGPGDYAMAFVRAGDAVTATVFDLPGVVPLAREYVEAAGLSDRVGFQEGDYNRDDLGRGYDLAFLSAVIHSNSPDGNRALIRKAAGALDRGGRVVIQDFIVNEERTAPAFALLFALNMLVNTKEGDTFTFGEVKGWMDEAGLSGVEMTETPFGTGLVTGRKE